ncbi:MAG: DUF1016 N-terminal domain-containing protein [Alphaproteobacteria bacterium]
MNDIMNSKDYTTFLNDIKKDIQTYQVRAALAVNQGLVLLHWRIGNGLLEKQSEKDWDASCVKQLSVDLLHDFPEISAFLPADLKTMRVFAGHFTDGEIVAQKIEYMPWDYLRCLLNTFDSKQIISWYVQKCLEANWGLEALNNAMAEKIHISGMDQTNAK